MNSDLKYLFFEQVASIGQVLSNPKRLEIIELLCQGEKSVDLIANQTNMNIKLASSHLQNLKNPGLIESRKEGKFVYYKISDDSVILFYNNLKKLAENKLISNKIALNEYLNSPENALPFDKKELLRKAKMGEVIVIDLRPKDEYLSGHIPYARSIPINELEKEIKLLPKEKDIVAYCRGATCVWSHQALEILLKNDFNAYRMRDGITEWKLDGMLVSK